MSFAQFMAKPIHVAPQQFIKAKQETETHRQTILVNPGFLFYNVVKVRYANCCEQSEQLSTVNICFAERVTPTASDIKSLRNLAI
jgi:hypothetical protein